MRTFLSILAALVFSVAGLSQNLITYSGVEKVEGVPASELFARAKKWTATSFVSAKDVTQMADNNTVVIKAKHLYDAQSAHHILDYTLTIECRDGRYKWTVSQITYSCMWMTNPRVFDFGPLTDAETNRAHSSFFGGKKCDSYWKMAQDEAAAAKDVLVGSLFSAMSVAPASAEDDW